MRPYGAGTRLRHPLDAALRVPEFFCGWRVDPNLAPDWKPEISGFVIWIARHYAAMMVTVDPARPNAWKRPPYYRTFKQWGGRALMEQKRVIVMLNGEATIVLPDADQALGKLGPGETIDIFREGKSLRARIRRP